MIEINRAGSEYIYKIDEKDNRLIRRRFNRHNARWEDFRICASAEGATKTLLKLEAEKDDSEE